MSEEIISTPEQMETEKAGFRWEVQGNGDDILIPGNEEELVSVAQKICKELDPSFIPDANDRKYLLVDRLGITPAGMYYVVFSYDGRLCARVKNARGDEKYRTELREAVERVLGKDARVQKDEK